MLWLDYETRSQCDLKVEGTYRYAQHPTTEIVWLGYAFDDDLVMSWVPEEDPNFPEPVNEYILSGKRICAQHAVFDRLISEFVAPKYGAEVPKLTQWICSSAWATYCGLPASLEDIGRALELPVQKQKEGKRLIREYCCPNFLTEWKPGDKDLMGEYCERDVETMRGFCKLLPEVPDDQWLQYHITQDINDHGVPVNIPFAEAALEYSEAERSEINTNLQKLTDGFVQKHTERKNRDIWLREHLADEPEVLQSILKSKEEPRIRFDQDRREILIKNPRTPEPVKEYARLVEAAGGATISKYKSMVNTHIGGRVQGALVWSGALSTGRYISRGLQFQNMKRETLPNAEDLIEQVIAGVAIDNVSDTLAKLVRSSISSKSGITYSDFSQIEAMVLPWLTDSPEGEKTLDIFRDGRRIYTENAKYMFGVEEVTKDLDQGAKMGTLACGFGGSKNAVHAMSANYGLTYTDEQASDIVDRWRTANPWCKPFWYGLKRAAEDAVNNPLCMYEQGKIKFMSDGVDWLWMMLPSGRCISYPQPRWEYTCAPWEDEPTEKLTVLWGSGKPKAGAPWPRRALSHIILSENAAQGTAADGMREAIVRAYYADINILFSVHDELVAEGLVARELNEIMEVLPPWATGLPLKAETKEAFIYGK